MHFFYTHFFFYAHSFLYTHSFFYTCFFNVHVLSFSLSLCTCSFLLYTFVYVFFCIYSLFLYLHKKYVKIYLICNKFQLKLVKIGLLREPNQLGPVLVSSVVVVPNWCNRKPVAVPGCPFMGSV